MSAPNLFVTSANRNQSLYITREEVIEAISSLGTLSSFNIGYPANPIFSTVTLPATGSIAGFAPIQTSNVLFPGTPASGYANNLKLGATAPAQNYSITSVDVNNSNAPLQGNQLVARSGLFNSGGIYQSIRPQSNAFVSADGLVNLPYLSWNGLLGSSANVALTNISTINGSSPNVNPTSYTTLTGTTINNSGVITSPSVVGVSSLNALPISAYQNSNSQPWVSYTVTNTASSPIINLSAGLGFTALTFSNCPIPTTVGREVTISIPISFTITTPPSIPQTLAIEAFLGGGVTGGTQVTQQVTILPTTTIGRITLCGVATVNNVQPVVNITVTGSGTFSATFVQGAGTVPRQFFFQSLGF